MYLKSRVVLSANQTPGLNATPLRRFIPPMYDADESLSASCPFAVSIHCDSRFDQKLMETDDDEENWSDDEFDTAGGELVDQLSKIGDRIKAVFGFQAKEGQLSAIHQLVYNKGDLILIARTGFGKSIVFQAIPLLDSKNRACCLVIMPLSLLEDDQKTKLDNIKGARPFVLNGLTNSRISREAIGRGEYTHG
jgi:superfamily II DNA helicase RecQ